MKKELLSFKNLLKFILIILFLLSISFIVEYNVKEYDKQKKNISNVVQESYSFLKDINAEEISNTSVFKNELKINPEYASKDIEKEKFLEMLDGNREALMLLSMDRLKKLDKYYDKVIEENNKIIKKMKSEM